MDLFKKRTDLTKQVASDVARISSGDESKQFAETVFERHSTDPTYRQEMEGAFELLSMVDSIEDSQVVQEILQRPMRKNRLPGMAVAACLLAVVASVLLLSMPGWNNGKSLTAERYVTRVGEQRSITLNDGSTVALNTNSELLVVAEDQQRRVILKEGEAYFQVIRDATSPFVVEVGDHRVTVLGTSFNVYKQVGQFSVAVSEGGVAVHRAHEVIDESLNLTSVNAESAKRLNSESIVKLVAGQAIEVDGDSMKYSQGSVEEFGAWRSGILSYADTPLDEIVKDLNRYSGKKILIEDRSIMDLKISAVIRVDRIGVSLRGFELSHGIRVKHLPDRIVLVGND